MAKLVKILVLILLIPQVTTSYAAKDGKYEKLVKECSEWSDSRIMSAGDKFLAAGDSEKALVMYMLVCNRTGSAAVADDVETRVLAHLKAGDVCYETGNYSKAQMFYVDGLKLSEGSKDKPYVAVLYKNIGNVHCMFQDYEKGIYLYKSGAEHAEAVNDNETLYKIYQNLMGAYIYKNDLANARLYYNKSKACPHKETGITKFMDGFTHALLVKAEGQSGKAVKEFGRLADYARSAKIGAQYECSAYKETYEIYEKIGDDDSAFIYLNRNKELAEKSGLIHMFTDTYKLLSDIYARRGDRERSLTLKSEYLDIKDSVFNTREFDIAKNQQFIYEVEKTERNIADLNKDKEHRAQVIKRQRLIIFCSVGGIIIVTLVLIYVYRQKRQLFESYRSLFLLNRQLVENDKTAKLLQKKQADEIALMKSRLAAEDDRTCGESISVAEPESKYKGSSLNDEQREKLADAITDVMDSGVEFCKTDFSLETLARLVGSNSNYVSQTINAVYGKNFSNFVNEYRVRLACSRLADTERYGNYTIRSIGESVGFGVYGTFINVFKRVTGMTPSLYQKIALEEQKNEGK